MRIKVINDGHSDIWDATALLTTTSPELNIVSASWQHDSLYVGVPEAVNILLRWPIMCLSALPPA